MSYKRTGLALAVVSIALVAYWYHEPLLLFARSLGAQAEEAPLLVALILIGLKAVSTPLGFPGTPLTLLVGGVFGPTVGTLVALIGNTLGAVLAFLLSRYIFRGYVQRKLLPTYPKIHEYERKMVDCGMSTVVALRLIPLFPFNALNFMLGATNLPLRQYVLGSFIGMIPGTFAFVYLGGSLTALSPINIGLSLLGIVALILIGKWYEKRM